MARAIDQFAFREIVECAPDPVLIHARGRLVYINEAGSVALRYEPDALVGADILQRLIHPDDRDLVRRRIASLAQRKRTQLHSVEVRMRRGDESWARMEASATRIEIAGVEHVVVMARDVSEARQFGERLEALHKISSQLHRSGDAGVRDALSTVADALEVPLGMLCVFDDEDVRVAVASGMEAGLRCAPDEASASIVSRLRAPICLPDVSASTYRLHPGLTKFGLRSYIAAPVHIGPSIVGAVEFGDHGSRRSWSASDEQLVTLLARSVGAALEIRRAQAALATANEHMTRLAFIDELTGLPNRRDARRRVRAALDSARRDGTSLCVGMLDIDHFKRVNDTFGHQVGDAVLQRVARRTRRAMQGRDECFRLGGEEFLVMWSECDAASAMVAADRILTSVRAPVDGRASTDLFLPSVTASIGVAEAESGDDIERLLARADRGLYRAKQRGRNRAHMSAGCGDAPEATTR